MPSLIGKVLGQSSEALPVPVAESGIWSLTSMSSGGSRDSVLLKTFKQQGTVHSNAGLLASATAGPSWHLYREPPSDGRVRYTTSDKGSDQRTEVVQHPAIALLNSPGSLMVNGQRFTFISRHRLFEMSQLWMELTGKAHWVVDRVAGVPVGIWPVRPDRMQPVPDRQQLLKGWLYTAPDGQERIPLSPDEVVFNVFPDSEDLLGGTGWAEPVLTEIEGARYATEWNRNFFANSAKPDGVITVDHRLSDEEWDELTERWRETHRGVARSHRVAVLEAGAQWVTTSTTAKDMDFANLLSTAADRIREASGMHKVMTGVTEDVNRANAQTGEEIFASWKVAPRLERWRDVLNTQYLPMFGATAAGVELDFVYPVPQNREQDALELTAKSNAALALVSAGYDQHDVLEVVGLPDMNPVLTLTDQPALPPRWTAPPPAAAPSPAAVAVPAAEPAKPEAQEALRLAAGWSSPAWAALDELRRNAVWNSATAGGPR